MRHAVSRSVFLPVPNVDSALRRLRAAPGAGRAAALRALVAGAFAHRRKTLANSLALAGRSRAAGGLARDARAALESWASRRTPGPSASRRRTSGRWPESGNVSGELRTLRALAPAKINLGLFLGPVRESDGRHELATVMQSILVADQPTLGSAAGGRRRPSRRSGPGLPGAALAARALAPFWPAPAGRPRRCG